MKGEMGCSLVEIGFDTDTRHSVITSVRRAPLLLVRMQATAPGLMGSCSIVQFSFLWSWVHSLRPEKHVS